MSFAIIRNEKMTRTEAKGSYVHNERRTKGHMNKDIDSEKTHLNYYLKKNELSYIKEFDRLKKENNFLHKVVDRFKEIINVFITWICKKFYMGAENNLIRDFERENNILIDAEKQVKREERDKDFEMER